MAIQVVQITGDTVELVFNPAEDDLHIGENLSLLGRHENRGIIVQIIELQAIFSAAVTSSRNQRTVERPQTASPAVDNPLSRSPRRRKLPLPARETHGLPLAIAKIRKMMNPTWHPWDGWIPMRSVIVTRTADHELLRQCIAEAGNPLWLGKTLTGEPFHIERVSLGTVNLIVGAKGSGTSHLAKVIVGELIAQGVRCAIFDTTGAYGVFSPGSEHASITRKEGPAIVHLTIGENLKLGLPDIGLDALLEMLKQFGLPKAIALYFESHVARRLAHATNQNAAEQCPPFFGIDDLMSFARDLEAEGHVVVGGAILSCLDAIKKAQIFASLPAETTAFWEGYAQIRHGGALVIDLSKVPIRARTGVVSSLVGIWSDTAERDRAVEPNHPPCMVFDDAHGPMLQHLSADVLMPAGPLGRTSFFVTTMVTGLEANLLHAANNLFMLRMTADDDVRHLARCGVVDAATLRGVVRRLPNHHSLLIGGATEGYPIVFAVNPFGRGERTAERPAFSRRPAAMRRDPTERAMPWFSTQAPASAEADLSLPLFPDETQADATVQEPAADPQNAATSPPSMPTVAQVTAMWDHVVKRVARRRRILETILSAARPLRVAEQKLVLSFPPQHRFQQELVESEEYRSLLEEELKKAFGVSLEVTTEVYPG
jgi:hypothetical protein